MLVLDGNPQETINVVSVSLAIGLVGVPVASQAAATIWSRFRYKDRQDEKSHGEVDSSSRPAAWVVSLLIYSYGLLIPALCLTLFNMMIGAVDAVVLEAKSESTFGLISLLAETGSWTGAVLVTTFAIVIPLLKLYLLLHAECIRRSKDVRQVSRARHYIGFVQVISKWACPDMIAYIFLLYLVRHLNRPPINGLFTLDIGFACYTLFCWGSTISSLGIHPPRLPDESRKMDLRSPADPFTIKIFGKKGAAALMLLLFMIFAVLFILGMRWPVLGLRLDAKILKQNGLPPWQIRVMEDMHVAEHAKADVTIFQCLQTLAEFQAEAFDASALLAIIMLAVFVIGLPVLDMLTIAISSLRFFVSDAAAIVLEEAGFSLVKLSRRLRKLAMLDVLLLGVIVVVLSASIYRSQGMVLFPGWGLLVLTGAELAHYAAGWSLWGLTRVVRPAASEAKALDHPSSGRQTTVTPQNVHFELCEPLLNEPCKVYGYAMATFASARKAAAKIFGMQISAGAVIAFSTVDLKRYEGCNCPLTNFETGTALVTCGHPYPGRDWLRQVYSSATVYPRGSAQTFDLFLTEVAPMIPDGCVQEADGRCDARALFPPQLAKRVASVLGEEIGQGTVGYRISGDTINGKLCFVTVGYLLQRLVNNPEDFQRYTHVVLDEVHERGVDADLLSLVIKLLMHCCPTVKLIVMSATLQATLFADYFSSLHPGRR
ncbi:unnamed protein product, partial [Symbiodinium necroappetens]